MYTQSANPCRATMINHQPPKPPAALDALDFEITDFDEARRALEQAVRARAKDLLNELDEALTPCRKLAEDLAELATQSDVAVPPVLSPYARALVGNEVLELKRFVQDTP